MLKIFKAYHQGTSILDDFYFYEEKENMRHAQKGRNLETTNQDLFSDDFRSISVVCAFYLDLCFEWLLDNNFKTR